MPISNGLQPGAVLSPGTVYYFVAPVGTPLPQQDKLTALLTAGNTLPAPWAQLGHTDLQSFLKLKIGGGEVKTLGTAQVPLLREVQDNSTYSIDINLQQFDPLALRFCLGDNILAEATNPGWFRVQTKRTPVRAAMVAVVPDTLRVMAFANELVSFKGTGDIDFSKKGELGTAPVTASFLQYGTNGPLAVFSAGATSTSATAGTPGAFMPATSVKPFDLAEANALVAAGTMTSPGTAWTTGQYVVGADGSEMFWNGTAFAAGRKV